MTTIHNLLYRKQRDIKAHIQKKTGLYTCAGTVNEHMIRYHVKTESIQLKKN